MDGADVVSAIQRHQQRASPNPDSRQGCRCRHRRYPLPTVVRVSREFRSLNFFTSFLTPPQYAQTAFRGAKSAVAEEADKKQSNHVKRILEERKKVAKIDPLLEQQFKAGRLLAVISSRPGQSGRADGYILEGKELEVSAPYPPLLPCLILIYLSSSTTTSSRSERPSTLLKSTEGGSIWVRAKLVLEMDTILELLVAVPVHYALMLLRDIT